MYANPPPLFTMLAHRIRPCFALFKALCLLGILLSASSVDAALPSKHLREGFGLVAPLKLDTQLVSRFAFKLLAQGNREAAIRALDDQIFGLTRMRNRRYSLVGPIVQLSIGVLLLLPGSITLIYGLLIMSAYGGLELGLILTVLGAGMFVPGLILVIVGATGLARRLRGRRRMNMQINDLRRQRDALLSGGHAPPPDAGNVGPPPPGPGGPDGALHRPYSSPLLSIRF